VEDTDGSAADQKRCVDVRKRGEIKTDSRRRKYGFDRGSVEWEIADKKAKSDIILSIKPSELKQVKACNTSREVWLKLQSIYQSSGPARKATLLKRLTLHRMDENGDVRPS